MRAERELLIDSTNSEGLEESADAPFKGVIPKSDSIVFESASDFRLEPEGATPSRPSFMGNVPLLLEKRKQGIIEDNMAKEDGGLGKWVVGKMVGGGGSGRVHRALNIQTGCLYAVKKVHLCEADEEECKTEISILSKLSHDNVVRYVEHYHLPEETLIFMEYVPSTLKKFYKDFGPPPLETFLHFARQLVVALAHLHEHKIMHKDLKCANVLLTNKGVVKLSDFGCSKDFERTISFVNYQAEGSKTQKGTPHWMAPESIVDALYNIKTDIWGLGCTLLELATGQMPWHEKAFDSHKIMMHIGSKNEVPFIPGGLPAIVQQLIRGCLVRDPEGRLPTKELLRILSEAAEG
jgi:mitogen-activated protein kinase kinase kinase ANP1